MNKFFPKEEYKKRMVTYRRCLQKLNKPNEIVSWTSELLKDQNFKELIAWSLFADFHEELDNLEVLTAREVMQILPAYSGKNQETLARLLNSDSTTIQKSFDKNVINPLVQGIVRKHHRNFAKSYNETIGTEYLNQIMTSIDRGLKVSNFNMFLFSANKIEVGIGIELFVNWIAKKLNQETGTLDPMAATMLLHALSNRISLKTSLKIANGVLDKFYFPNVPGINESILRKTTEQKHHTTKELWLLFSILNKNIAECDALENSACAQYLVKILNDVIVHFRNPQHLLLLKSSGIELHNDYLGGDLLGSIEIFIKNHPTFRNYFLQFFTQMESSLRSQKQKCNHPDIYKKLCEIHATYKERKDAILSDKK